MRGGTGTGSLLRWLYRLAVPRFQAIFTPCVEIGWRLSAEHWGQGLATEGAREIVRYAFRSLGLEDLVSFTVPGNSRSRRVMEKLGMTHNPADDFDHPNLPRSALCAAMSYIPSGARNSNQHDFGSSVQKSSACWDFRSNRGLFLPIELWKSCRQTTKQSDLALWV